MLKILAFKTVLPWKISNIFEVGKLPTGSAMLTWVISLIRTT